MRRVDSLENSDDGRDWGQEEKGTTEEEMARKHQQLNRHESEQIPGDNEEQGSQSVGSQGHKVSDTA